MSWDGATLEAYCQPLDAKSTSDELSIYTTLDFDTACFPTSGVANHNGYLSCTHVAANAPPGPWSETCSKTSYSDVTGILSGICGQESKKTTFETYTAVNYTLCTPGADVNNMNGLLQCTLHDSMVPGGSWIQTCAAYSFTINDQGYNLTAYCSDVQKNTNYSERA